MVTFPCPCTQSVVGLNMIRVRTHYFGTVTVEVTALPGGELATLYTLSAHRGGALPVAELLEYSVGRWTESWWFRPRGTDAFERVSANEVDVGAVPFDFSSRPYLTDLHNRVWPKVKS